MGIADHPPQSLLLSMCWGRGLLAPAWENTTNSPCRKREWRLSRLCHWLGGERLSSTMPGDTLALMVTTSHPARQDVAMSTLGQRWQCLEEKTAVERVLLFLQHQQLQAGLGSHIGSKGKSPRLPHVTAVWHLSGPPQEGSLGRLCQRKSRKFPGTGCSWGANGGPERQGG